MREVVHISYPGRRDHASWSLVLGEDLHGNDASGVPYVSLIGVTTADELPVVIEKAYFISTASDTAIDGSFILKSLGKIDESGLKKIFQRSTPETQEVLAKYYPKIFRPLLSTSGELE